jgi:hypothetical protein
VILASHLVSSGSEPFTVDVREEVTDRWPTVERNEDQAQILDRLSRVRDAEDV